MTTNLYKLALAYAAATPHPSGYTSWTNLCGVLCYRFTATKQGWAKAPGVTGPYASSVANASGALNTNYAAAPIGAYHFWNIAGSVAGHVGQDLSGGGVDVFMATSRAVRIRLQPSLGIQSVPGYSATGATYRGWATNYGGGLTAYVEPAPAPSDMRTTVAKGAYIHSTPDSAVGSRVGLPFKGNVAVEALSYTTGETVGTSNIWFYAKNGNGTGYISATTVTDPSTAGVPLNQYVAPVVAPPVVAPPTVDQNPPATDPPVTSEPTDPPVTVDPPVTEPTDPPVTTDPPTTGGGESLPTTPVTPTKPAKPVTDSPSVFAKILAVLAAFFQSFRVKS